ncbi:hypothetical protein Ssi03_60390 [Sphaerisporangium siamense]|nr:hypothetical protein Ssi03_60390 [Sphaerisporangium siamense]
MDVPLAQDRPEAQRVPIEKQGGYHRAADTGHRGARCAPDPPARGSGAHRAASIAVPEAAPSMTHRPAGDPSRRHAGSRS